MPAMPATLRDVLIQHIDGPSLLIVSDANRYNRIRACVAHGWLHYSPGFRPKATILTNKGREALCAALEDWATAIIRSRIDPLMSALANETREVAKPKDLVEA